jgi:hypothetical protein
MKVDLIEFYESWNTNSQILSNIHVTGCNLLKFIIKQLVEALCYKPEGRRFDSR